MSGDRGVVAQTGPVIPTSPATTCAVVAASPVTMTVRTPRPDNSETRTAESSRGGSLSAMKPASANLSGGPAATASTRNPFACKSSTIDNAFAGGCDKSEITANAPLATFIVAPFAWSTLASERFSEGSKGTNVTSFGASAMGLCAAAPRIAASTGSCPPSELARAANARTCASSKPGIGRTDITASSLRVSVPVLSEHRMSTPAASSTAERLVGSTPWAASERAPTAAASVNIDGSATGIEERSPTKTRATISAPGSDSEYA